MRSRGRSPHAWLVVTLLVPFVQTVGCEGTDKRSDAAPEPKAAEIAEEVSQEEFDRLRALGYVRVVEEHDSTKKLGILHREPEVEAEGLVYFTNAFGCSSQLMRADGEVVHQWRHEPCYRWENTVLLPDGDVVAIHRVPADLESVDSVFKSWRLLRVGWDGQLRWKRELPVHHDIDVLADGRIAALTYDYEIMEEIHADFPIKDNYITILDAEGGFVERASLTNLLRTNPSVFTLQEVRPSEKNGQESIDLMHANAIEWMHSEELASRDSIYALSNVLVTIRHQDIVAIFDWPAKKLVWAWGLGDISGPHDGTVLANGNILIFDNGLRRRWSRVIEVDPLSRRIVWEYQAPDRKSFFTGTRGAAQRLPNGNTLITNSKWGRVFEVTPGGEIVWDFRNSITDEKGRPSAITRARRLPGITTPLPKFPRTDSSGGG